MTMHQRLRPEVRHDQILTAALKLAARTHYSRITRDGIAEKAKCSTGLVTKYFTTMPQLRRAVMRAAVVRGVVPVIAQGIAAKDRHAMKVTGTVRKEALALLAA